MIRYTMWVAGVLARVKAARALMWLAITIDQPQGQCAHLAARLVESAEQMLERRPHVLR
jgi:hypothetical protein